MTFQPISKSVYRKYLSILLLLFAGFISNAQEASLSVIGNNKGAPSTIKMNALKSILKGEQQRWKDGTKVTIVLMKTSTSIGESTCKKIYNMSGDMVKRFWLGLSFSGRATAPIFCNSISELESIVSDTPGAIGITNNASTGSGFQLITVDGKMTF